MKNILKITDSPIKGYPDYAYALSVVMNKPENEAWLYCNYLQLYFLPSDVASSMRYYYTDTNNRLWNTRNPLLDYQLVLRDMLKKYNIDIIDFIIDSIDSGFYLYLYLDEYFIENRIAYKKERYPHTTFFYGYDTEKEVLYSFGYDSSRHLSYETLSFDVVRKAYEELQEGKYHDDNLIYLFCYNETGSPYHFDINSVIRQLTEFVDSVESSYHYDNCFNRREEMFFGMEALEKFKEYLCKANELETFQYYKNFFMLWEYVDLMNKRIDYMIKEGYLQESTKSKEIFQQLEMKYKALINMYIKYISTQSDSVFEKILTRYDENKELLEKGLKTLLEELKETR